MKATITFVAALIAMAAATYVFDRRVDIMGFDIERPPTSVNPHSFTASGTQPFFFNVKDFQSGQKTYTVTNYVTSATAPSCTTATWTQP